MNTGHILITIPQTINWGVYEKELEKAAAGEIMNFKVSNLPVQSGTGKRCYLCYKGKIIGWMLICGFQEQTFKCTTTGKLFSGKFVQRTGAFHRLSSPVDHKGFQGYRYISEELFNQLN